MAKKRLKKDKKPPQSMVNAAAAAAAYSFHLFIPVSLFLCKAVNFMAIIYS